jgi:digeranylgeranylglycerophospholipid reductase
MPYDVVVVGAGPAGAMTARTLAEAGVEVLLVEKRPEIGVPVRCGEATGIAGLKELGIPANRRFIANETRGAFIYSPDKTRVELVSEESISYILERRLFDKYLALHAARAGAEVRAATAATGLVRENGRVRGVELEHRGERYTVECGCVVGADGVEGNVGRWAGLNTRARLRAMIACVQFELVGVELERSDIMEFYFGSKIAPGGYAWVFPKGRDVANVGLGVRWARRSAYECLLDFVASMENLREGKVISVVAGGVPVQGPLEKSVAQGVLLVGDAARQLDPLTGGGIYNAMHCGVIAGRVLKKAVDKADFSEGMLMEYDKAWRKQIGSTLVKSLQVRRILDSMSDEELNAAAKVVRNANFRDFALKDETNRFPLDMLQFVQGLLLKN